MFRGEKMKKFFKEFKEFAARGNVLELAVAVVIGGAFGKIVTSLVNDIIMPLFGIIFKDNFANLTWEVNGSNIAYGAFVQAVIDFLIVAFCIFLFTKLINKFKKKEEKGILILVNFGGVTCTQKTFGWMLMKPRKKPSLTLVKNTLIS